MKFKHKRAKMVVADKNQIKSMTETFRATLEAKANGLRESTNYSEFKFLPYNRPCSEKSKATKDLIKSIKDKNMLEREPVEVNKNMEIVDGQHRFLACKLLGLPVKYVVVNNFEPNDLVSMNRNRRNWAVKDYLRFFAETGNSNYQKLEAFHKESKIPINGILTMMKIENKCKKMEEFKDGLFHWPDDTNEFYSRYDSYLRVVKLIKEKSVTIPRWVISSTFCNGTVQFLSRDDVNLEAFLERLEANLNVLRKCTRVIDQLAIYVGIYNYKVRAEHRIEVEYTENKDREHKPIVNDAETNQQDLFHA